MTYRGRRLMTGFSAVGLCVFLAFGPYLGPVRFEQVGIYLSLVALAFAGSLGKLTLHRSTMAVIGLWLFILALATANTMAAMQARETAITVPAFTLLDLPSAIGLKNLFGGLDNFLLPMAVIAIVGIACQRVPEDQRQRLLDAGVLAILICLCLNSLFALSIALQPERLLPVASYFWPSGGGPSVALAALAQQRIGGAFNQPGEAGSAYSLGLILWMYRYRNGVGRPWAQGVMAPLLLLGAILCSSKIVFLAGFPLALIYYFLHSETRGVTRRYRRTVFLVIAACFAMAIPAALVVLSNGNYLTQFSLFMDSLRSGSLLEALTGGRVGGGSSESSVLTFYFDEIMKKSPLFGLGFGSLSAYDSAYIHILALAGLVGVAAYLAMLAIVAYRFMAPSEPARLGLMIIVMVVLAGTGMPVLVQNRVGSLVIFCLALAWKLTPPLPQRSPVSEAVV
ncbi:MAG: hypothetical protein JSS72_11690 [Armatimonadetes bacterium]|nr:hypothetical protein [Armatimonadota bacterium]